MQYLLSWKTRFESISGEDLMIGEDKINYIKNATKQIAKTLAGLCAIYFLIEQFGIPLAEHCLIPIGSGGLEIPIYVIGFISFVYAVYLSGKNAVQESAKEEALKELSKDYNLTKLTQEHERVVLVLMDIIEDLRNKLAENSKNSS